MIVWHGIRDALLMSWQVWWALVFGFTISAMVQAWVPAEQVHAFLGRTNPRSLGRATLWGAASSSCSYAAVAIARSLFSKGASFINALAFQLASTNLVWELGLVIWVLIGWRFTAAEYVGGLIMIIIVALISPFAFSAADLSAARKQAQADEPNQLHDHQHVDQPAEQNSGSAAAVVPWHARLRSIKTWIPVATGFDHDWQMVGREIVIGIVLAGFAAQIPVGVFHALLISHGPSVVVAMESVPVGALIAIASCVCSVGNVPLVAVLWSNGLSFGGVLAFLFADLVIVPIVLIYRRYYGTRMAIRISLVVSIALLLAVLITSGLAGLLHVLPSGPRPTRSDIFSGIHADYRLILNSIATGIFLRFFWLSRRSRITNGPAVGSSITEY